MNIPRESILYLFKGELTKEQLVGLDWDINDLGGFKNEEIYWLNTPGPIYTTQTDNCGTGQPEALNNVGGDEDYYEFIFKQPFNEKELIEIKSSADVDPLGGYYIDGNKYWTNEKVIEWWGKIESVIDYMIVRYDEELKLPANPHNSLWDFGDGVKQIQLYGPPKPLPENYKSALDFYQFDIKNYLEWYMKLNNGLSIKLDDIDYNWDKKMELDEKLKTFNPKIKDLIKEYNNTQKDTSSIETQEIKQEATKNRFSIINKLKKVWRKTN